jgi:hypothetical protein
VNVKSCEYLQKQSVENVQEVFQEVPAVGKRLGSIEQHSHLWESVESLGKCLKPHQSKLQQEQAAWRRAAQQQENRLQ